MDQKKTMAKPLLKVKGLKKYFPIRKALLLHKTWQLLDGIFSYPYFI